MSTINTIIDRVGRTSPNALGDETLARYLLALDGRVYAEVTAADAPDTLPPLDWPGDADVPLLIAPPHDLVYDHYLAAMIAWHMREYENYNNAAQLFTTAYNDWRAWYRRTHRPAAVEVVL